MNLCSVFKKLHVINLLYYNITSILHEKANCQKKSLSRIVPLFCPSPQLFSLNSKILWYRVICKDVTSIIHGANPYSQPIVKCPLFTRALLHISLKLHQNFSLISKLRQENNHDFEPYTSFLFSFVFLSFFFFSQSLWIFIRHSYFDYQSISFI